MKDTHDESLSFWTKLAYGAGDFGPAITANISVFYLLFFFTNVVGLSGATAGSVLMIGKIADAVNDPIIGMWSDQTRTPWGRRLPWMIFGAIPFGLFFVLQWFIPSFLGELTKSETFLWAYFVIIGILFNVTYTAVSLPYQSLTPELTLDYNERTNLNSFRFSFSIGGSILSLILYLLIFKADNLDQTQRFIILAVICSILSIIATLWCTLGIQERGTKPILNPRQKIIPGTILAALGVLGIIYSLYRAINSGLDYLFFSFLLLGLQLLAFGLTLRLGRLEPHLNDARAAKQKQEENDSPSLPFKEQLKIVFNNRPFLYVIGIYLCSWLAVQLTASIIVYFVVSWMRLPEAQSGLVALAVQGTALIMLFFWQWVSQKLDKKVVYSLGVVIWIIAQFGLFSVQPGQEALMYFLAFLAGWGVSVAYLIPWSMVPDVIELDELKTGQRREGTFYAFMVLLQKFGLALGLFLVGIALDLAGFKAQVPGGPIPVQPDSALWAIRMAIGPLPAIFLLISLVLAYFYPLTRTVHAEILLQLAQKKQERSEKEA
ncbi:MAG: hypothetical protein N5P05_001747 [Chroococcopsis gigantea SAG 12.99]|jgi:GPH family glycoside/pentoside/hexuronide:cation symporter|nr:hypothetical protein [Chroococcopsis gigantea SAG 12.99]